MISLELILSEIPDFGSAARFARGKASAAAAIPFPQPPFPRRGRLIFAKGGLQTE